MGNEENSKNQIVNEKEPLLRRFFNQRNIVPGLTVIISIIALGFSWQANQIAKKQSSEIVTWIDTRFHSNNIVRKNATSCAYLVTLSNHGGAKTAIFDYDINIFYQKHEIKLKGRGGAFIRDFSDQVQNVSVLHPYIEIGIYKNYFSYENEFNEFLPMPYTIDSGETKVFTILVFLPITEEAVESISHMPVGNYPWDWYERIEQGIQDYFSVEFNIDLHLTSGRTISTPKVICTNLMEK